ncbi:MAG: DUF3047 domain-containing protein [Halieaceae bacterium]|nr:DUF3047 domain-containing protein [Halieaceae bacterium]
MLKELRVVGKLALRALARRMNPPVEPPANLDRFIAEIESLATQAGNTVRDHCWLTVPADSPPWMNSGLSLESGDEVSYFIEGRVYASRLLDIWVNPGLQLWCKVGPHGEVFRGLRNSHSFRAERDGELLFGNYFPNSWANRLGERQLDDSVYDELSGELKVLVIRWQGSALDGLQKLASDGTSATQVTDEIERIGSEVQAPQGWHYLWHIGPAEIFSQSVGPEGGQCIQCRTHGDVGILQKDIDLPLDAATEISWRWRVDSLPSDMREALVPTHDYLSLAVEFDSGRDITYYWSSKLPVGTGYDCPLPTWSGKEFHVVVRSGPDELGHWHAQRRNLHADHLHYMGAPPERIVRVWLIANSVFQRGRGACDYADIVLHGSNGDIVLL